MQALMKTGKVEWNYVLRMCIQHHCYFGSFYTWSNIFLCLRGTFLSRLFYLSASLTDLKQNKFGTTRRQKSFVKLAIWSQNIHQCTTMKLMSYVDGHFKCLQYWELRRCNLANLPFTSTFDRQGFKSSVTLLWSSMQCHTFSRGPEVSWALQNSASASLLYT